MIQFPDTDQPVSKSDYQAVELDLRVELIRLHGLLRTSDFSVLILLAGNDLVGCNQVLNLLVTWLDPRYMVATAFGSPTPEELRRPFFWRYWQAMVPRGRVGVFVRSWVTQAIVQRMENTLDDRGLAQRIREIQHFENALANDGALLLKFWLHLPKGKLARRLAAAKNNPEKYWRVHPKDRVIYEAYDRSRPIVRKVLRDTGTPDLPWNVIDGSNQYQRNLLVGKHLLTCLTRRLEAAPSATKKRQAPGKLRAITTEDHLPAIDLERSLTKASYTKKLNGWQRRLYSLSHEAYNRSISTVIVFEGWDAAGKGGVIRRMTMAMDAAIYRVIPIAAPTDEESRYHYLWRFWRYVPSPGKITIFDRSWYGRVLVERVENFASEAEWLRAYSEINQLEEQLVNHGILCLKFWIHIDAEEQLLRFEDRERTSFKQHKMSDEDYRNRQRWSDYEIAVNDMLEQTNTPAAPWHLIPGNDKRYARIAALKIACRQLKERLAENES